MGERELEHISTGNPATRLLVGCMAISYSAEELEHIAEELKDAAAAKRARGTRQGICWDPAGGYRQHPGGEGHQVDFLWPGEATQDEASEEAVQTCGVCGCTDERACIEIPSGQPCSWTEPGLCSACDPVGGPGLAIRREPWPLPDFAPGEPGDNP